MPITSTSGQRIADNVVTDVNANLSVPAASSRKISPEAAILFNKGIVARALGVPDPGSIRVKNTEYAYRWVNRLSQNGATYMLRRAQGFVNATPEDVEIKVGDAIGGDTDKGDGSLRWGDLILMKIRQDLYDAALKNNMETALRLSRMRGVYMEGASGDVNSDSTASRKTVAGDPFSKQVSPFIPPNADAIVDDSINSGRVEKTRETISRLQDKA